MTGSFGLLSEEADLAHYGSFADMGDDERARQKVEGE